MAMLKRSTKRMTRTRFKSTNTHARAESKWRSAVRTRDNYTCRRCGRVERQIHCHHIAPRSRRPDLKFDVNNGMCLDKDCHAWCHSNPIEATAQGFLSDATYELAHKGAVNE